MSLSDSTLQHLRQVLTDAEPPGGRYRIGALVGEGGMGTVYRARDRVLDRDVALKVLRADIAAPEAAARLRREARILARLEHPGIVPVHDVGTLADGRVYYVMKLVRGDRLEQLARGASLAQVLRLFLRVCETVGFAHAAGVIHRDLKPSNIMVGPFGEVLVLDWGIARLVPSPGPEQGVSEEPHDRDDPHAANAGSETASSEAAASEMDQLPSEVDTSPGTILGTPGFMAPEQAQGWMQLVSPRTDVFALGAILRHLVGLAASVDQTPPPLVSVWTRAMQPQAADRYAAATELAADVARFLDGAPVEAHRETLAERAGRLFRRYQTAIILVLTYLIIRLLFLALRGL
jgi:eukaryotic-like serine/threonine-protein kinase